MRHKMKLMYYEKTHFFKPENYICETAMFSPLFQKKILPQPIICPHEGNPLNGETFK